MPPQTFVSMYHAAESVPFFRFSVRLLLFAGLIAHGAAGLACRLAARLALAAAGALVFADRICSNNRDMLHNSPPDFVILYIMNRKNASE